MGGRSLSGLAATCSQSSDSSQCLRRERVVTQAVLMETAICWASDVSDAIYLGKNRNRLEQQRDLARTCCWSNPLKKLSPRTRKSAALMPYLGIGLTGSKSWATGTPDRFQGLSLLTAHCLLVRSTEKVAIFSRPWCHDGIDRDTIRLI